MYNFFKPSILFVLASINSNFTISPFTLILYAGKYIVNLSPSLSDPCLTNSSGGVTTIFPAFCGKNPFIIKKSIECKSSTGIRNPIPSNNSDPAIFFPSKLYTLPSAPIIKSSLKYSLNWCGTSIPIPVVPFLEYGV